MTFGLQVNNLAGSQIISETYRNYHLVQSGAVSNTISLPQNAGDLVFIRPHVPGYRLFIQRAVGGVYSNSGAVAYVIVRESPIPTSEAYGLKVFTNTGAIAFDSTRRGLHPVLVARIAQGGDTTSAGITLPALTINGRQRYVNLSAFRVVGLAESGAGPYSYARSTAIDWWSDTSMTLLEGVMESTPAPYDADFPAWGGTMVFSFADI